MPYLLHHYEKLTFFNFRNSKKSVEKIKTMEQDVVDMEIKLKQMQQERSEIEQDAKKLLTCIQEIEGQLLDGDESFTGTCNLQWRFIISKT